VFYVLKQVEELEEQLKIVTFQRKRADKATLEVLSFLASQGISDISEVYESDSDQEESLCESNDGGCDASEEAEKFGSLKSKGNNEASGSESDHDSTASSGRALSWKGRKETARSSDKKKFDSSSRRRTGFAQIGSTQRLRHGKSCRQIKRREMRLIFAYFFCKILFMFPCLNLCSQLILSVTVQYHASIFNMHRW